MISNPTRADIFKHGPLPNGDPATGSTNTNPAPSVNTSKESRLLHIAGETAERLEKIGEAHSVEQDKISVVNISQ